MSSKGRWIRVWAVVLGSVAGCGGGDDASEGAGTRASAATAERPAAAAGKPSRGTAPPVTPAGEEPRYEGRTLSEYAAGLDDLSPRVRRGALDDVHRFGREALPVRERVQRMVAEDPEDELRLVALALLFEIEDPDAPELLRRALRDPEALASPEAWVELTALAGMQVPEDELVGLLRAIAREQKPHGERLLQLVAERGAFPGSAAAREALARAHMGSGGSAPTVAAVMRLLPALTLGDAEKIRYVRENVERLPSSAAALDTLRGIGGEDAFAAALAVLAADPSIHLEHRLRGIQGFAAVGVPAPRVLDALDAHLDAPGRTDAEIQQVFAYLDAAAGAERNAGRPHLQALLTARAGRSEVPQIRALSVLYLGQGVGTGAMGAEALAPVLERLRVDADEVVLGTASKALQQALQQASPERLAALPGELAGLLYARDAEDPWALAVASGGLDALRAGLAARRLDVLETARALAAAARSYAGSPVNPELLLWIAGSATLFREPPEAKRVLAGTAGELLLDPALTPAHAERLWATSWVEIDNPARADIETILAFVRPVLMAKDAGAVLRESQVYQRSWLHFLVQTDPRVRDPKDRERFLAFVAEVAQDGNGDVRMAAFRVLNTHLHHHDQWRLFTHDAASFEREIGGRSVRIKPLKYINKAFAPSAVETERADEGFLAWRQNAAGLLCDVAGLARPYDVVFLDAEGTVLGTTTTEGPEVQPYGKYRNLTHPQASHALLLPKDAHAVRPGERLPLDPRFLATL